MSVTEAPLDHDHAMRVVAVDFDDAGHAIRETRCEGCGETSYDG